MKGKQTWDSFSETIMKTFSQPFHDISVPSLLLSREIARIDARSFLLHISTELDEPLILRLAFYLHHGPLVMGCRLVGPKAYHCLRYKLQPATISSPQMKLEACESILSAHLN
jgi:hypothetical protein